MSTIQKCTDVEVNERSNTSVNAYLILRKGNQVLLYLRENTGYLDGQWGFPAGHVELGENATSAIIRETKEEVGIDIKPENLKVVHTMHRKSNRMSLDVFFECDTWEGDIQNCEPEKCGGLEFQIVEESQLPIIDYCKEALIAIKNKVFYSENGF